MKSRRSGGVCGLNSTRIALPRLRSRSAASKDSTRSSESSASSSNSMSRSRTTRNTPAGPKSHCREQMAGEGGDDILEAGEAGRGVRRGRQRDEAPQPARQADQAAIGPGEIAAVHVENHRHFQIGNEGEGMGRIDRDGRDGQEDVLEEMVLERFFVRRAPGRARNENHAGLRERRAQLAPGRRLVGGHGLDLAADLGQRLRRGAAVEARGGRAGLDLLDQSGDAHHEEFVEIIRGDRQEAQPFEQRAALVHRLFEHAAVESQPGQLAIDETRGRGEQISIGPRCSSRHRRVPQGAPGRPCVGPRCFRRASVDHGVATLMRHHRGTPASNCSADVTLPLYVEAARIFNLAVAPMRLGPCRSQAAGRSPPCAPR